MKWKYLLSGIAVMVFVWLFLVSNETGTFRWDMLTVLVAVSGWYSHKGIGWGIGHDWIMEGLR